MPGSDGGNVVVVGRFVWVLPGWRSQGKKRCRNQIAHQHGPRDSGAGGGCRPVKGAPLWGDTGQAANGQRRLASYSLASLCWCLDIVARLLQIRRLCTRLGGTGA